MKIKLTDALKIFVSIAAVVGTVGCHSGSRHASAHVSATPSQPVIAGGIWVPDQFSSYSVGRYVDPNDPAVMHDAHTLYRREESGRWNLAPAGPQIPAGNTISSDQKDVGMLRDALTAELNRQRVTSLALIDQAQLLGAHLREFSAQSQEFQNALKQLYSLRERMSVVSNRLDSVEYQLRTLPAPGKSP